MYVFTNPTTIGRMRYNVTFSIVENNWFDFNIFLFFKHVAKPKLNRSVCPTIYRNFCGWGAEIDPYLSQGL